MSFNCDLCKKRLVHDSGMKWVVLGKDLHHICLECIKLGKEIVNNTNTGKVTYINEYKEMKEMGKV